MKRLSAILFSLSIFSFVYGNENLAIAADETAQFQAIPAVLKCERVQDKLSCQNATDEPLQPVDVSVDLNQEEGSPSVTGKWTKTIEAEMVTYTYEVNISKRMLTGGASRYFFTGSQIHTVNNELHSFVSVVPKMESLNIIRLNGSPFKKGDSIYVPLLVVGPKASSELMMQELQSELKLEF